MNHATRAAIPVAIKRNSAMGTLFHHAAMCRAFVEFADWLGRPFSDLEAQPLRWLLLHWEEEPIVTAMADLPEEKQSHYLELIAQVREVFVPDPPVGIRYTRTKMPAVAVMHDNGKLKSEMFQGVSPRRLTQPEADGYVQLLVRQCNGIAAICRELALVRNRDLPEAERMGKLAKSLAKLGTAFSERPNHIPSQKSVEEVLEEMAKMEELMIDTPVTDDTDDQLDDRS